MVIGECGVSGFQADLWRLADSTHAGPSVLIHAESGLCLDVEGGRVPESSRALSRRGGDGPSSAAGGGAARGGGLDDDGTPTVLFECHGGANQLWRPAAETCTRDALGLCLGSERFRADLTWRSFDGTTGSGKVVPVGSDDSGLLWFFEADNWEMLIKVLDGCAINDRFWVFAAATTTVEYTLRVTDTALGTTAEYFNPLGNAADAITDTDAFATCSALSGSAAARISPPPIAKTTPSRSTADLGLKGDCVPSLTNLCLSTGGRFRVEAEWRDYDGNAGSAQAVPMGSEDSGLLWFFDSSNWEMLVKVLDACHLGDARFLMLAAATTDVEYTLRVTDTESGVFREFFNPLGNPSAALVDSFYTCP